MDKTTLNRRVILQAGAGAVVATGSTLGAAAQAGVGAGSGGQPAVPYPPGTLAPRGRFGRMERLPTLGLESRQDFLRSFRTYVNMSLAAKTSARSNEMLEARGVTDQGRSMSVEDAANFLKDEPLAQMFTRSWLSAQQLTWGGIVDEYMGNVDTYLAEMEAVDDYGPYLELNPDLEIPEYAKYEIHIMPGGYVGSPIAGHLYHYGTNGFYMGRNDDDEIHRSIAKGMVTPKDGRIRRILDIGCGIGQLPMAFKEKYPGAEVWGIDVGGPMVRYAHLRATERKLDVNFAQRLGEDSRFPDNHFDVVTSYLMFHEADPEASQRIIREAYRITRPGGVFYPLDFDTVNEPELTAFQKYRRFMDHRWNCEPFSPGWRDLDVHAAFRDAGFELNTEGPVVRPGSFHGILNATKPA